MPAFLAAIPIIGSALKSVFDGINELFPSEVDRMKAQNAILMSFQPVILTLVQAQAEFDRARADLETAAMKSEDWFVRRSRPAMSWVTFAGWQWTIYAHFPQAQIDQAFYAFCVVAGIWSATRGGEKIVSQWIGGKNGNGK